ncbi:MAG TPA: TonB-dependent receptor plug domain-containing protein, partial [Ilumatobacteraceae bacterium]|nr:TonB-dependent receptor plug domain-containing protein [Ilumatobacteraceae bacterium]
PIVDTKKVGTATVVTHDELNKIPSSRDPWALLRTIPGVIVDRVNIAGSESGQQSYYTAKGADQKDSVWSIDGIVITDMQALGSSPGYYTYDTFDEVNVTTGGSGVSTATGGLGINMVTKRGTNEFRGGIGGFFTNDDLQWGNAPAELLGDPRLQGNDKADHTDRILDWSAEFGGPILKDKLWFYGSYGRNDIRVVNLNQQRDKSVLTNYSAKLNWQASTNDMVSAFWFLNDKTKIGRLGAAGSLAHLEGTRWDQGNAYSKQPHGLTKLEWNHIFSADFFLNAKGSYYSTGFSLEPQGGLEDSKWVLDNINRQARGTTYAEYYLRPQTTLNLDGSWFKEAFGGSHEIKFGLGWRSVGGSRETVNPGNKVRASFNPTSTRARFYRDRFTDAEGQYWSGYVADTFNKGRLILSAGLRWDLQRSRNKATSVEGNPLIPELLPGLSYEGDGGNWPVEWNTLSPRAGFTLALDEARKTLVRGSYAWYAGQLSNTYAALVNPVGLAYLEYDWRDLNGDEIVQLGEVDFSRLRAFGGVDPQNPSAVGEDPDRFDPDLSANRDHEVIVGVDRELAPNLVASVAYTWRRAYDLMPMQLMLPYWYPWVGIRSTDYLRGETSCERGFCATPWVLDENALNRPEVTGGIYWTNRQGFAWNFNGLEFSLVKRMANKWMGRVAFSWNNWTEDVEPEASAMSTPTSIVTDPKHDGGIVVSYGAGTSGKVYYMNAKWQL